MLEFLEKDVSSELYLVDALGVLGVVFVLILISLGAIKLSELFFDYLNRRGE